MKQSAFIQFSNLITGVITLPDNVKEKKNPFIIVNTDNDRGLYVRKLEKELYKFKNLKSSSGDVLFDEIETNDLIVFGDSPKYDYRVENNYLNLVSFSEKKDVKVYDLIDDFDRIVRRLATYTKNNNIKRKYAYRDNEVDEVVVRIHVEEEPKKKLSSYICPLLEGKCKVKKTLVNVYKKPDVTVEKITVHDNWVKIGWNQYDIWVDLKGREFIKLEDGEKLWVETDRFGKRYLAR